jgi:F-type H+-transporting ATPase subunit b
LEEVLKILNPMSSTIFWSIIVFVILIVVLWRFIFKPVNNIISKRQTEIQESINSADKQKEEAQKFLEEQKIQLDEAKKEARKIIEDGKTAARKVKGEIEEKALEKSRAIMEAAVSEINTEKERSIAEVKNKMVDIALAATEKMIAKNLSEKEHKKLIEETLREVEKI